MSDTAWIALGNIVATLTGALVLWLKLRDAAADRAKEAVKVAAKVSEVASKADAAAARAKEANTTLQDATKAQTQLMEGIAKVGEMTHTLVNSQHGLALKTIYEQAVKLAGHLGTAEAHADVAQAKQKLDDHERKQALVDQAQGKKATLPYTTKPDEGAVLADWQLPKPADTKGEAGEGRN